LATPPKPAGSSTGFQWQDLLRHNDVLLAVGMVLIIGMLLIPMPSPVLDLFLTVNIALSVTILLVALYTREALEYSTFPTILLMATLFRLGLNVSSTRLILLNGEAGTVIEAFGNFVIGGNYVVGLLIFIILIIINFIVITNGAGRVSEVGARFTLDAMPGKQLSIDADLNAGLINEEQARERRTQIQREADFYGTMDGASKFVKGDAIAGIIITVINIVGGLIIGVMQLNMPVGVAASTFTVLTVGDGLVSQLPALVISSATGILVTRVAEKDKTLGDELGQQMFTNPKVLAILSSLLILLGLVPGMPMLPFLSVGGLAGGAAYLLTEQNKKNKQLAEAAEAAKQLEPKKKKSSRENVLDLLEVETLELEIGYRLVTLIEPEAGGDLLERIAQIRRQVASDLGFVLPSVRVRDNLQLPATQYHVKLRGVTITQGEVQPDMWMAMCSDPELADPIDGIETKEPAFGLPALWIESEQKDEAEISGYTVVSPSAVIATHLSEVIKSHACEILSRQDTQELLDNLKKTNEALVSDLVGDALSVAEIHVVLQQLLRERVSVRNLAAILETLSYHCRIRKDPDYLCEQARLTLSRAICKQHSNPATGQLPALTLAPELEELMVQSILSNEQVASGGLMLALSPMLTNELLKSLNQQVEQALTQHGVQPVILCNAKLRLQFRRLIERLLPQIAVLSYSEIGPSIHVHTLGSIRVNQQNLQRV
jgi:flagellar biosynthesis protein FlhA